MVDYFFMTITEATSNYANEKDLTARVWFYIFSGVMFYKTTSKFDTCQSEFLFVIW